MQLLVAQGYVTCPGDLQKVERKYLSRLTEAFPTPVPCNPAGGGCLSFPLCGQHLEKTEAQLPLNHRSCVPLKDRGPHFLGTPKKQ